MTHLAQMPVDSALECAAHQPEEKDMTQGVAAMPTSTRKKLGASMPLVNSVWSKENATSALGTSARRTPGFQSLLVPKDTFKKLQAIQKTLVAPVRLTVGDMATACIELCLEQHGHAEIVKQAKTVVKRTL
jgi:hypothetical protein